MGNAADAPLADLLAAARAWAADDPDAETRAELEGLATSAEAGDEAAAAELADAMAGMLEFGTAGLRGRLGGGPNRMNRAVVIRAAAGLTAYLRTLAPEPFVVVGFDARTNSDVFAHDTCAVIVGMGGRAAVLPHPLPTPVLAYAIRHLGADAGVMVTASHNPPEDNGYKVFVGDGSQIVAPVDGLIAAEIAKVTSVASVFMPDDGWHTLDDSVLEAYLADVVTVVAPDSPRELTVVHTALHGVGSETVRQAFLGAGYAAPIPVASQAEPDPMFPTVRSRTRRSRAPWTRRSSSPSRPRPTSSSPTTRMPTGAPSRCAGRAGGGCCAATRWVRCSARLSRSGRRGVVPDSAGACSPTRSCPRACSRRCAAAAGVRHEETLTGFKWIGRVPGLRYGYEEALGYCVAPDTGRDKDGVSAALLIAELAAALRAEGRSLSTGSTTWPASTGCYATDAFSVRVEDLSLIDRIMERLRAQPLTSVAGVDVARADDLARGDGGLPPTEGLRYYLADDSRIIVRPSGTEPKLKVYLEVVEPVGGDDVRGARERAAARLAGIRTDLEAATSP